MPKKTKTKSKNPLNWFRHLPKKIWLPLACLVLLVLLWPLGAWLSYQFTPMRDTYSFATSFSKRQSESLGLDWKANYTALLDDLKIRDFRLMSYWDMIEAERGQFDFKALDWQMDQAAKRDAKISLAIGLRQPRWPECHEPEWAIKLDKTEWKQALYAFIEKVVNRYEDHPALANFQLENEAMAWWFGDCRELPDQQRLVEEYRLVDSWTDKPIWMSLSDQYGVPVRGPIADGMGYSLYTKVYNNVLPGTYVDPSPPIWYHNIRASVLRVMYGRELFVHELQLEPWGSDHISKLSVEEQNITMSPERIHYNVSFARKIGFDKVYTWGSEWWYWRLQQGDDRIWEAVRTEIIDSRTVD